jgi:outer membrane receptor for ferric coprogen and ferric-rhodotorulic acid
VWAASYTKNSQCLDLNALYLKYFLKRSARPRKTGLLARKRESYELGPKADFFDGRLSASAAYFEIHENNRRQ